MSQPNDKGQTTAIDNDGDQSNHCDPGTAAAAPAAPAAAKKENPQPSMSQAEQLRKIATMSKKLDMLSLGSGSTATDKRFDFWYTQPVPKLTEPAEPEVNEPIQPPLEPNQIGQQSLGLPAGFTWVSLDLDNETELQELYTLLYENYVEDDDNLFRFNYSKQFLLWVLKAPGWQPDWFVGVRVLKPQSERPGKLVGFISAIPSRIRVYEKELEVVEINFLCVHKKLRSKRMAPVLISEITRRVRLRGIFQALYTAGVLLPKPVASCRYHHRSLNPKKLVEVRFSSLGRNMTIQRLQKLCRVPESPALAGLRPMEKRDVKQVQAMLTEDNKRFDLVPMFTLDEVAHWLLPVPDVIESYVVERPNKETGKREIVGFFSFYILPSSVMNHPQYKELRAAYSFYNVGSKECSLLALMQDALVVAKNLNIDVFNALNQRDNDTFLDELKFGRGDGDLRYYLFNWKCPPMTADKVGVVLQ